MKLLLVMSLACVICLNVTSCASNMKSMPVEGDQISFPANYKETFTNYLSLDRTQNPDQIIRLFANDTALQGPGADGKLPFGSVLVAEIYKAQKDADGNVMTSQLGRRDARWTCAYCNYGTWRRLG